jgi:predicted Zn-dependent protease with MMP-like domain
MRNGKPNWTTLALWAEREVTALRASFPEAVRIRTDTIPVVYEPEPDPRLVADGVEPDTLGMFVGSDFFHETDGHGDLPPQIFLFLGPLWDDADGDEACFRSEVRRTFLHEIGHYLGWEEADLKARDLE